MAELRPLFPCTLTFRTTLLKMGCRFILVQSFVSFLVRLGSIFLPDTMISGCFKLRNQMNLLNVFIHSANIVLGTAAYPCPDADTVLGDRSLAFLVAASSGWL